MMEAMTSFDGFAILIVLISTIVAVARGFLRELSTLGAFIAAITAGYYARLYLKDPILPLLPDTAPEWAPSAIPFVSAFLTVYIIIAWFGSSIAKSIHNFDGLNFADRFAGSIFGLARGAVLLVFFVYLLNLTMDADQIPEFISGAQLYPIIEIGAEYLLETSELADQLYLDQ